MTLGADERHDTSQLDDTADRECHDALSRILTPDSIVLDVGANLGQFATSLLSVQVCTTYCFEPVPEPRAAIEALAAAHPNIIPVNLAVSDRTGPTQFRVMAAHDGSSMLEPLAGQTSQWLTPKETIEVESTRLDDFMRARRIDKVDLLKSDAQGYDGHVLESAGDFLTPDHIQAILVEVNFHSFYEGQDSFERIMEICTGHGYFLAGIFRHYNYSNWLWWADALFLPNRAPFSTQF